VDVVVEDVAVEPPAATVVELPELAPPATVVELPELAPPATVVELPELAPPATVELDPVDPDGGGLYVAEFDVADEFEPLSV
jgi:hypothetical protein